VRRQRISALPAVAKARADAAEGTVPDKAALAVDPEFYRHAQQPLPITRSDDGFIEKHNIEFVTTSKGIDLQELNDLFEKVGFPSRDLISLQIALDNTHLVHWARCTKTTRWAREGQLIGFARATSDRAFFGTIWDVAVLPSWQRSGIGKGLVERLVNAMLADGVPVVSLFAEPRVVGLYEKLGFMQDFKQLRCMAYQHPPGSRRRKTSSFAAS